MMLVELIGTIDTYKVTESLAQKIHRKGIVHCFVTNGNWYLIYFKVFQD